MTEYTHQIVKLERTTTKGSGSPMWRCTTSDGQTVNVFKHHIPERDTFELMLQAGYAALTEMEVGEVQRWTVNPIQVQLVKDGDWWKLAAVEPRPKNAEADAEWMPDIEMIRNRAELQSRALLNRRNSCRFFDFESTGVENDDEMVAASVVMANGGVLFDHLLEPQNPQKLLRPGKGGQSASEINGITPDMLKNTMLVEDALVNLAMALTGHIWVAYNAPFDVGLLERECMRYKHPLMTSLGIHDAMRIFAEYVGEWQSKTQSFRIFSLSKAARMLDIDAGQSHTAKADALTMVAILKAIASGMPIKTEFGAWAE